jgi:hypothetical protein
MDAASWGSFVTYKGNEGEHERVPDDSAYERAAVPAGTVAAPRGGFRVPKKAEGLEPHVVWILVVGSIVGLVLLSKTFRTASA